VILPEPWIELQERDARPLDVQVRDVLAKIQRNFQDIQLQAPAPVSADGRRLVVGAVDGAAGTVLQGAGFTSSRTGAGAYTLTFAPAFGAAPVVVVSAGGDAGDLTAKQEDSSTPTASEFKVKTFDTSSGTQTDAGFFFIAAGVGFA
jgi:hypothetical protein